METSRSPRMVLNAACCLGQQFLPDYSHRFSQHTFTLAQLFACLIVCEFFGLSYRRAEALLKDSPSWLADIGLAVAPDHNTLWRVLGLIAKQTRVNRALDRLAEQFKKLGLLRLSSKPLAMDSTCFERQYRSVHYERRCRQMAEKQNAKARKNGSKNPAKPGKWGKSVNASRRRQLRAMPKLARAVASASHVILAAKVRLGNGSDSPDFEPLLKAAHRRAPVKVLVADAGYDSEENHRIAREELGVRSIIPPGIGRPTSKLPSGRWRRHMVRRTKRKADEKLYGQRAQVETVHSMIKRNQSSALRSRTPQRRKQEMLLRVLTHNIMLLCTAEEKKD